jgi:NAD+ kinase
MKKVLIFGQEIALEHHKYFHILLKKLENMEVEVIFFNDIIESNEIPDIDFSRFKKLATYEQLIMEKPDFVFTLGGDGTILRAVTLIRDAGIPILGINLGRLGFLAIAEKDQIENDLDKLASGMFSIQQRSMLKLEINDDVFGETPFALNDITFHKYATSSVVVIHTWVDDMHLNSYWADGLIISTPTGSTGYSLSCGGPIILPGSKNFVITPVAPHQLTVRPIVIPDTSVISFQIEGRTDEFLCTLDSRFHAIHKDHTLRARKCDFDASLVVLEGMDFVRNIYNKLLWGLDKRQLLPDHKVFPK